MEALETTSAPAPAAEAPASPPPATEAPKADTAPEQSNEAPERDLDEDLSKVWKNANKLRDETGKFTTKDGRPPKNHNEPPEELPAEAPKVEEPKAPAVPAPRSWAKEAAEKWSALPPEVQQYVHQRETEVHRAISTLGQQAKQMEPLRQILEQNRQTFERNGTDYTQGIAALIQAQNVLDNDPVKGIANLAQIYGVDLRNVVGQIYGDQSGLPPDPQVSALELKIQQLERQLTYSQQQETARQRAIAEQQAEQQRNQFQQRIESFAKDKADFDEVAPEILANIQVIQQTSPGLSPDEVLQQAYERAIWAHPKTREARMKAEETRRLQEAAKQAEQAKRASSINVRSAPKPSAPGEDIDADLRSVWRRANARS